MRPSPNAFAALAAIALLAAGCSRAPSSSSQTSPAASAPASSGASAAGDFGTLTNVCHGASASGSTDQGVTSSSIEVGVLTDVGFTKDPQLKNAAAAFTSCYDIEQASPAGWEPAPFDPNDGVYRCGEPPLKLGSGYPAPMQLSDVGKTLGDLK
jgi:hypothetical protein